MADLIARLRNPMWSHRLDSSDTALATEETLKDLKEAADTITRLRAALTTIHAMSLEPSGHEPNARRQMGEIAMRALEGEKP